MALTSANLAVVVTVASFTAGMGAGFAIDRNVMNSRIDRITAQHAETLREREAQRARDEVAARQEERRLVLRAGEIEQEKINEIDRVRSLLAAADARLQNRPDRQPAATGGVPSATSACQGATGAELSRQDGQFLVGEAARANELRAALSSCYAAYDSVGR